MTDYITGGNFYPNSHTSRLAYRPHDVRYTPRLSNDGQTLWLVPDNDNAHYIWCSGGIGSRGLGGSSKEFPLIDAIGGVITLKGPWHANPTDLYKETGCDLRGKHETWGVLATGFTHDSNSGRDVLTGLIHIDPSPIIGAFDRIEQLGKSMTTHEKLFYYSESVGGSSYGRVQT